MEGDDLCKKRLRKLNLNAPILSTRRVGGASHCSKSFDADQQGSSQRVPFSWEQVPGTPKGAASRDLLKAAEFRPPKLPPCQWHSSKGPEVDTSCTYRGNNVEDDDDAFSDAIDMFSLSESLDVADSTSNSRGLSSLDLKIVESREHQSPDFIIRRFLPDANALASTYAPTLPNHCLNEPINSHFQRQYAGPNIAVDRGCSPPKACGIGLFLLKHSICGLKDPILDRHGSQDAKRSSSSSRQNHQGASVEVFCKGGGRVHYK
ncbi:hypothetical protein AQUCO_00400430v1 [Aquilegia coerulea]|uniref:DUF688 domain-containing protein n=1 Tax=Aquilegia coerulea TaxID=218851 RepID=A0A2G5EUW3_AQUCA|nr:hypothetical protein AQUCO_00400430v1 [Aquilegia coerulea]